jgi:hypothetical protein
MPSARKFELGKPVWPSRTGDLFAFDDGVRLIARLRRHAPVAAEGDPIFAFFTQVSRPATCRRRIDMSRSFYFERMVGVLGGAAACSAMPCCAHCR